MGSPTQPSSLLLQTLKLHTKTCMLGCQAADAHVTAALSSRLWQACADVLMLGVQSTSSAQPAAAQQPATTQSAPFTSTHASTQVAHLRQLCMLWSSIVAT